MRTWPRFADDDIGRVRISGRTDLAGQRRIMDALSRAHGNMRSLSWDLADLRLLPTAHDIASLHADGYVAEVIEELREAQGENAAEADARVAREALTILCGELVSRQAAPVQGPGYGADTGGMTQ